eukprot:tig00020537_g10308.t1
MPGDGTVGTAAVRLYPFDAPSEHTGPAAPPKAKKQRAEPQPKQIGGARVFFREGASGAVFSVAAPADAQLPSQLLTQDDDTACAVCHNTGDGGVMILCDGDGEGGECKFAIHTYCCKPKLDKVLPRVQEQAGGGCCCCEGLASVGPRGRPAGRAGGGSSRKAVRAPDAGPAEHESTTSPEAAPRCLVCCSPGSLEHMVRCTACELVAHPYCAPGNPQRGSSEPYFCPGCLACSAAADGMQARGAAHDADTPLKRMNAQLFDDTHLGMTPSHGMGAGPHLASAFLAELEQQGGAHGHGRPAGADDGLFSPSSLLS